MLKALGIDENDPQADNKVKEKEKKVINIQKHMWAHLARKEFDKKLEDTNLKLQ